MRRNVLGDLVSFFCLAGVGGLENRFLIGDQDVEVIDVELGLTVGPRHIGIDLGDDQ